MPGYSEECTSGAHTACANRDCRCGCHPAVQALIAKAPPKMQPAVPYHETAAIELNNSCPKCGGKFKATDNFCRNDGTRLMLGKQCIRCGSPGDEADQFCWNCSWKHGEPLPTDEPEPAPTEDPVVRARRIAKEQGLLRETTV